nr:cytochrome P450 6k1-like [Onthophagus taurus]
MEIAIFLAIIVFLLYKLSTKNFGYWKKRKVPFLKPTPIFGNFYECLTFKKSIGEMLQDMYKQIPDKVFGIWVFNKPHVVIKDPELIKMVLVKDFQYFSDRTVAADEKADSISSNILFVLRNPEWKVIRKMMTPAFTSGKIKSMIPLMAEAGDEMVQYIEKRVNLPTVESKEICAKYATDVITSCAFGVQGRCFQKEDAKFRQVGKDMFEPNFTNGVRGISYFFLQELVYLLKIKFIPPNVSEYLKQIFWSTINLREKTQQKRNDVIDIILKLKQQGDIDGVKFDGDIAVAQAIQFFLAGFETTSSTMAFTLYELCLNKSIQTKLRSEIKSVLKKHDEITYEAIQSMKYLDKVVSETLRKYPVLPFLDRMCNTDYKLPGTDIIIEKGTPVYIPMFGLHYDEKYWKDPQKYDPERFSDEEINKRHQYAYIPFGSGPHNCIGERFGLISTKLGLVNILNRFEVEKNADTPIPLKYSARSFVLASTIGLPMKFIDSNRRASFAA